jgi:phosphoglycolate phosphatase
MPWYREHLLDHAMIYPGLRAVLERLAEEGAVFSVLTNKPADMSATILAGLDLEGLCPRLIGGDTLPVRKPDPTGLRQLIALTGVGGEATLMVGDSAVDVATGRNADVATCAVLWGFNGAVVRGAGADVEIGDPSELLAICRQGLGTAAARA